MSQVDTITLDLTNDILKIFAPTKKIKDVIVKQITGFDEEIQVVLDVKLKNSAE